MNTFICFIEGWRENINSIIVRQEKTIMVFVSKKKSTFVITLQQMCQLYTFLKIVDFFNLFALISAYNIFTFKISEKYKKITITTYTFKNQQYFSLAVLS